MSPTSGIRWRYDVENAPKDTICLIAHKFNNRIVASSGISRDAQLWFYEGSGQVISDVIAFAEIFPPEPQP